MMLPLLSIGYFFTVLNSTYRVLEIVNGWERDSKYELLTFDRWEGGLGGIFNAIWGDRRLINRRLFGSDKIVIWQVALGRRQLLLITNATLAAAVLFTFIPTYGCLAIGRALGGVAIGYYTFLVPLSCAGHMFTIIVRELSPVEISGIIGSFFPFAVRNSKNCRCALAT